MPQTQYVKVGDRKPFLYATLADGNNNPVNLSGATVTLNMNDSTGSAKIADAACVVDDATNGRVHYEWGATDTNTAGVFAAEFAVNIGGIEYTFPNFENITVVITPALG